MLNPKPVYDDEELIDFETFCAIIPDGQKADLIDGVIYVASPDSRRANTINGFLHTLLNVYISQKEVGGEVYFSRFAFRMSEFNAPEPDVAYVRPQRVHLIEEGGMRGGPDIAVEIVAKESRHRDFELKRALYEAHGVEEYWLIDYLQKNVELLRLESGKYHQVPLERGHILRSAVLPGFWFDSQWVLAKPLPSTSDCLDQILSTNA